MGPKQEPSAAKGRAWWRHHPGILKADNTTPNSGGGRCREERFLAIPEGNSIHRFTAEDAESARPIRHVAEPTPASAANEKAAGRETCTTSRRPAANACGADLQVGQPDARAGCK